MNNKNSKKKLNNFNNKYINFKNFINKNRVK